MSVVLGRYTLLGELPMVGVCKRWIACSYDDSASLVVVTAFPTSLANHSGSRQRLEFRAAAAARLRLAPILRTHDWGVERSRFFIAEELAYGESLEAISRAAAVEGRGIPVAWVVKWGIESALALHAAHTALFDNGRGPVLGHGGIEPGRLLIDYRGRVRVSGYGVGDIVHYANLHSSGRAFASSQRYQAPEQNDLAWPPSSTEAIDCYQLGLVLWNLINDVRRSAALETVLSRATAPEPGDRFDDLRAFAAALQECPVSSAPENGELQTVDDLLGSRAREWADVAAAMERADIPYAFELATSLASTQFEEIVAEELADTLVRAKPHGQVEVTLTEDFGGQGSPDPDETDLRTVDEPPEPQPPLHQERYAAVTSLPQQAVVNAPMADHYAPGATMATAADDEDFEEFHEPFSAELLVSPPARERSASESGARLVVEVIRTVDDRVVGTTVLRRPSRRYFTAGHNVRVRLASDHAEVQLDPNFVQGTIGGVTQPPGPLPPGEQLRLAPGQYARLDDQGVIHQVRVFYPPVGPAQNEPLVNPRDARLYAITMAASIIFHLFALIGVVLTATFGIELTVKQHDPVEVFAEGSLKKLEEPEPKEKKKKEPPKPKKKPKPTRKLTDQKPADPTEQKAMIPKSVRKNLKKRLREKQTSEDNAENLLAALTSPVAGEGETVTDVVSNIDAPNKGSTSAAFRVAGTLQALEGKDVNIATGGGGKLGDIGGQVAKDTGKLERRKSSGKVRGKVTSVKALAKVQGSLSRADVYQEINRHLGKIQGCYENELLKNPGIAGKITFEWTVKTNGRVRGVREISSTVGEKAVSKCVQRVIDKMKFPRPKGGEVIIRYPFIFRSSN